VSGKLRGYFDFQNKPCLKDLNLINAINMPADNKMKIAIVDPFKLFRKGMISLLQMVKLDVHWEYENGHDFISNVDKNDPPNFVLMDLKTLEMEGYETTLWLRINYPTVNVLALCFDIDELGIKRIKENGVKGYFLKTAEPAEIKFAITSVIKKGHYYPENNWPSF
jgi:two-component system invasion response regulator UvrY